MVNEPTSASSTGTRRTGSMQFGPGSNAVTTTKPRSPARFATGPERVLSSPTERTSDGSTTTVSSGVKQIQTSSRWSQESDQKVQCVASASRPPSCDTTRKLACPGLRSNGATRDAPGCVSLEWMSSTRASALPVNRTSSSASAAIPERTTVPIVLHCDTKTPAL